MSNLRREAQALTEKPWRGSALGNLISHKATKPQRAVNRSLLCDFVALCDYYILRFAQILSCIPRASASQRENLVPQ